MGKKIQIIIFGLLILFLIVTRFYRLGDTAFFVNDQGRDIKVLYNMLINGKMTLIGPATSFAGQFGNIYFGSYYYYFLLPFYLISQNAYFMTGVFPALFIVGVLLFFLLKEFKFGQKFIISLLLVFSWFSLYYTRFLWNLNLAFLLSFILFSAFLVFKKRIVKHGLLSLIFGLISGMVFQVHYGMLFLYVSLLVFFFNQRKNLLLYLLGFIASFFPFLLFDIRHEYVISKNILSYVSSFFKFNGTGASINSLISIFAKMFEYYLLPLVSVNYWVKVISALLIYLSVIIFHLRKKREVNMFIAMSFIIFFLSFFVFKRDFDYYLACFMIWFYIGLGLALYDLAKKTLGRYLVIGLLVLFIGLNYFKYFTLPINSFGLAKQYFITQIIKDSLLKNNTKELSILVLPHGDDVNSLEYLMTLDNYYINPSANNKYLVCYGKCIGLKKVLYSDINISVYTDR